MFKEHSDPWPVTVTFRPIRLSTNFMTWIPNLTFTELRVVSKEHLQWVWHVIRERLASRTPGSVPLFWDLLMLHLLRPIFSNLTCLFKTFHPEYPSVLSQFCYLSNVEKLETKYNKMNHVVIFTTSSKTYNNRSISLNAPSVVSKIFRVSVNPRYMHYQCFVNRVVI